MVQLYHLYNHKIKLYKENAINAHLAILTNNNKIAFSFIDNKDQQTKNLLTL